MQASRNVERLRQRENTSSCPDANDVERRRERERRQGGPSVPHNSVDADPDDAGEMTSLNINRASAQAFERVVGVLRDRVLSLALTGGNEETLDEASSGRETIMETIVIEDDSEEEEDSRVFIDVTGNTLEETIDLTEDSPAKEDIPPQEIEEDCEGGASALDSTMAMASSLKCPICLESFKELSKGGK